VPSGGTKDTLIDLASWFVVAAAGALTITQTVGWTGSRLIAVVQVLTPYVGAALVIVVLVSLLRRRLQLTTVAAAVLFGIVVLGTPLAFPHDQPQAAPNSTGLEVAALNLWYQNERIGDVDEALAEVDADVIVFTEFTPEHEAALLESSLAAEFPNRFGASGPRDEGVVVWSRFPIATGESNMLPRGLDLTVAGPDGDIRLVAMHFPTPLDDFDGWRHELAVASDLGRTTDRPTLLIGDLNSSYWHPDFRELLDAGFVDANTAAGSGFSTSWPTRWPVPAFVRLDHALTAGGLVSTGIDDIDVPGSDHRGLVVSVAPAR
jgi:endonuclease/exonuclease/phosphatase (EEP) superfamily protein YafD